MAHNQREWLLQVTTDSGLTGVTNARPAMNRDKLTALYTTLQLLLDRDVFEFYRVSGGRVTGVNPRWEELLREHGFIDFRHLRPDGSGTGCSCVSSTGRPGS